MGLFRRKKERILLLDRREEEEEEDPSAFPLYPMSGMSSQISQTTVNQILNSIGPPSSASSTQTQTYIKLYKEIPGCPPDGFPYAVDTFFVVVTAPQDQFVAFASQSRDAALLWKHHHDRDAAEDLAYIDVVKYDELQEREAREIVSRMGYQYQEYVRKLGSLDA